MEVCGRRELLLSLLETIVFHRLPNLEAIAATTKTKEANAYGWMIEGDSSTSLVKRGSPSSDTSYLKRKDQKPFFEALQDQGGSENSERENFKTIAIEELECCKEWCCLRVPIWPEA
ncbi:hypothetical protein QJS10_CPA03g01923 [Acorus calamus]|uniref:Uncharacterized protein n=1 Tax=Acorus calamus TaxID=4465 RepID=A0AAV9F9E9_ACOCL|nr:hypothetical protein QJS10_CPA03g01923 [Acorus calamus]